MSLSWVALSIEPAKAYVIPVSIGLVVARAPVF